MGQFDKKIKIPFELNNQESIKKALNEYQHLLKTDKAVESQIFQVEFVKLENGEQKPLQIKDGDKDLLNQLSCSIATDFGKEEISFESTVSEPIFFSHALKFEELESTIFETAREITAFSRRHNDTWNLWSDDLCVFGIDALAILALKLPQYSYLLGGYLIPYWDYEHADYVFSYMTHLFNLRGFDDNNMKMLCYCDNDRARLEMLGIEDYTYGEPFNLVEFFENNPEKYNLFKETMKKRFKDQPYLNYSDRESELYPVHSFFSTIVQTGFFEEDSEDEYDEDSALMEEPFMGSTFDNEASLLHEEIEAFIGKSIVVPAAEDESLEPYLNLVGGWEDFFQKGLKDGDLVWNYILKGKNDYILSTIEKSDILQIAEKSSGDLFKKLSSLGDDQFQNIQMVFDEFVYEYYEEPQQTGLVIKINGEDPSGRDIVLRAADVLFRLIGNSFFSMDFYELLIKNRVISVKDFCVRFDLKYPNPELGFKNLYKEYEYLILQPNGDALKRLYTYLDNNRELTSAYLESNFTASPQSLCFAFFALAQDEKKGIKDKMTSIFTDFIEAHWLDAFIEAVLEDSSMDEEDVKIFKSYIAGPPAPPKDILEKIMQGGFQSLDEEEKELIEQIKVQTADEETIFNLLQNKLDVSGRENDANIHYAVLDGFEDGLNLLVPGMYFALGRIRIPSSRSISKVLKLFVKLAPVKILKMTKAMLKRTYDNPVSEVDAFYDLRMDYMRIGMKGHHFMALDIIEEVDIDELITNYLEDAPKTGMFPKPGREDIKRALVHVPERVNDKFMARVKERDVNYAKEVEIESFYKFLKEYIKDNQIHKELHVESVLNNYDAGLKRKWKDLSQEMKDFILTYDAKLNRKKNKLTDYAYKCAVNKKGYIVIEKNASEYNFIKGADLIKGLSLIFSENSINDESLNFLDIVIFPEETLSKEHKKLLKLSDYQRAEHSLNTIKTFIETGKCKKKAFLEFETFGNNSSYQLGKSSYYLDFKKRERFRSLVLTKGRKGIEMGINEELDDADKYCFYLMEKGVENEFILDWLLKDLRETEVFSNFILNSNCINIIEKYSIRKKIEVLDFLSEDRINIVFLIKMLNDPVIRVRKKVCEVISLYSASELNNYGEEIASLFEKSSDEVKDLLRNVFGKTKTTLENKGCSWIKNIYK